jgi:hypothetical protein
MPLYIRRIVFAFFVIIFIISASAIFFYGSGYRWNGAKNIIEKTGQLSLDSKPKGAEVYINGELIRGTWKKLIGAPSETTPAVIKNLLPGEWSVEIKKEGYYSWKKDVRVISGQTAIFHDIRLIKNEPPQKLVSGNIVQFLKLSDGIFLMLTEHDLLLYENMRKIPRTLFHSNSDAIILFKISPDKSTVFLQTAGAQWMVDMRGEYKKFDQYANNPMLSAHWSDANEFYVKTKDGISRISSAKLTLQEVFHGKVDDFLVRGKNLFTIEGLQKKSVYMREIDNLKFQPIELLSLPDSGGVFLDEPSHDISIQKSAGGMTILSSFQGGRKFDILELDTVEQLSKKKDGIFLGWSDVELWKYELRGQEYGRELLTRQSASLQKGLFSRSIPAVFFLSGNAVTIMDMADGGARSQTQLIAFDQLRDMDISDDEKEIFLSGTFQGVDGLYALKIID